MVWEQEAFQKQTRCRNVCGSRSTYRFREVVHKSARRNTLGLVMDAANTNSYMAKGPPQTQTHVHKIIH